MDLWQRAKVFAEGAAKRSQEISKEAAKRSRDLTKGAAKFSRDFVTGTAKKSRELAANASEKADLIKVEALGRADQIKSLADRSTARASPARAPDAAAAQPSELETLGVTDELREFVKGFTVSTFRDFPIEDEPAISDVPSISNVRQDLNEWQARHAALVLSTVKEVSKNRYELCPRYMKERKFWRIYFALVNSYVAPYEKKYMEFRPKLAQHENVKEIEFSVLVSKPAEKETKLQSMASKLAEKETKSHSKTSTSDHDLDVFLLGDGSSDEGPDNGDGLDDEIDKI